MTLRKATQFFNPATKLNLNHPEVSRVARVYIFEEQPATNPPIASLVIGPNFASIPGLA
jgi:hypothetical protein